MILILGYSGIIALNSSTVVISIIISIIPDIDVVRASKLNQHHESTFHTPIFWLIISLTTGIMFSWGLAILIFTAAIFHLFCDYITGRTVGVELMYPIRRKNFSLYPLKPVKGDFNPLRPDKEKLKKHLSNYLENKTQLLFELAVNFTGSIAMIAVIYTI